MSVCVFIIAQMFDLIKAQQVNICSKFYLAFFIVIDFGNIFTFYQNSLDKMPVLLYNGFGETV